MAGKTYMTAPQLLKRFNISRVTLWNWIKSENLGFPKPIYINKIRYFDHDEVEAFEHKMKAQRELVA